MKSPKKRHKNHPVGVEEIIDILSWLSKVFQKSTFNNFCSHWTFTFSIKMPCC